MCQKLQLIEIEKIIHHALMGQLWCKEEMKDVKVC